MAEKKRILMIIPNLGFGGAERVFYDLAYCLSKNYDVTECVFNFDNGHAYPSPNKMVSLNVPAGKNVVEKIWYFFPAHTEIKKTKKRIKN